MRTPSCRFGVCPIGQEDRVWRDIQQSTVIGKLLGEVKKVYPGDFVDSSIGFIAGDTSGDQLYWSPFAKAMLAQANQLSSAGYVDLVERFRRYGMALQLKHYIKRQSPNTYEDIDKVIKDTLQNKIQKEHLTNYLKHSYRIYK
jgi:hypothetical protein